VECAPTGGNEANIFPESVAASLLAIESAIAMDASNPNLQFPELACRPPVPASRIMMFINFWETFLRTQLISQLGRVFISLQTLPACSVPNKSCGHGPGW
jgi:hypothetical protein